MVSTKRLVLAAVLVISVVAPGPAAAGPAAPANLYQSPYLIVSQDNDDKYSPAVAFASKHSMYLVVWENVWPNGHHDIYGRMVAAIGLFAGPEFTIFSGQYNSLQPAVTYDSAHDQFLVVWAYDSGNDGTDYDIYGRFIPWSGPVPSQAWFGIDESRDNTTKPRVAYGVTYDNYLVVWKVEASPSYIAGGLIYDNKSGKPVAISSGTDVRDFPDVTYNLAHNEFVAVWDVDVRPVGLDLDVYALRLAAFDGTPQGPEFPVADSTLLEQHPTVAACDKADQYLFVWQQEMPSTGDDLYGRWMTGSGVLSDTTTFIEGTTLPQQNPRLSCNTAGTEYFLTWQDEYADPLHFGIWAKVIHTDATMDPSFGVVAPSGTRDRLFPAVAYGKDSALVAWQHGREDSTYKDIWAQVIWTNLLPVTGLKAVNNSPTVLGRPTTLTATVTGGSFIIYTWGLGPNGQCCGTLVNYTFPAAGFYTVVVTATNAMSTMTATTTVAIRQPLFLPLVRRQ